jgi:hypothetical protein
MAKFLKIESSKLTPGIVIDPERCVLEMFGFSLPENAVEFYQPVIEWLNDFIKEIASKPLEYKEFNVIFKLVYYNSSSLRQIVDIFQLLHEIHIMNFPIYITWQYDSEDPQMADAGKELSEITKVPVNIVAYN